MRRKEYLVSYIAVIVLSLAFIGISLGMKYTSAKMLPLIISGVVILMASIGLVREITARHKSGATTVTDTGRRRTDRAGGITEPHHPPTILNFPLRTMVNPAFPLDDRARCRPLGRAIRTAL